MAKIVKKRTYHPSRLAEPINPASSPAVRHMRTTAQQMTQNANLKIPGPEGTRGSATRRGLASSIKRERGLAREAAKSKPKANVRRVDPNQMKTQNAPAAERPTSKTSADFAREAKAADDEFRSKMREADKIADEQIRRNDVNYREDEAKQLVREANEADRRRAAAERKASKLKDTELDAKEKRDLDAAKQRHKTIDRNAEGEATGDVRDDALNAANRSLVDQKAEAARTFAEARALDAELKRVDEQYMRHRQYYREAKKAGDEVDAAQIKEKLARVEAKADEIERKREALKKSGAPAMWGDQPRNELGQFWFK